MFVETVVFLISRSDAAGVFVDVGVAERLGKEGLASLFEVFLPGIRATGPLDNPEFQLFFVPIDMAGSSPGAAVTEPGLLSCLGADKPRE